MTTTLAPAQQSAPAIRRLDIETLRREHRAAKESGNYGFVTTSGLRLVVASGDAKAVDTYLLNEMGIKGSVERDADGILIGFRRFDIYSPETVMRALHGQFRVLAAMTQDGRQALKIFL